MADVKVEVELNMPKIINKVKNDDFGYKMAKEWKRLLDPYTPFREGFLSGARGTFIQYEPFLIHYNAPYSHYMYYGVVYVDPLYKVSGFTNDGGVTWFSRPLDKYPDAKKIPSGRPFNYTKTPNKFATDHWDKKAAQAGKTEQLAREMNKYLRRIK